MFGSSFAGGHPTDNLGAVLQHLTGMKGTFGAGEALNQNSGMFVNKYAHTMGLTALGGMPQK